MQTRWSGRGTGMVIAWGSYRGTYGECVELAQNLSAVDVRGSWPLDHAGWSDALRKSSIRLARREYPDHRHSKRCGDVEWSGVMFGEECRQRQCRCRDG